MIDPGYYVCGKYMQKECFYVLDYMTLKNGESFLDRFKFIRKYNQMRKNKDADLILTIAEQGFEGHFYKDIGAEAIIPMERIHGPILFISTEADTVWPSVQQADYIEGYLLARNFSYEVMNLKYRYISHFAIPMRRNEGLLNLLFKTERKYPDECAADRADISSKVIGFIRKHF